LADDAVGATATKKIKKAKRSKTVKSTDPAKVTSDDDDRKK
jgi:hypothetical protein